MKRPPLLLALIAAAFLTNAAHSAEAPRPNILLLIADQHFADAMSCAGSSHVRTPALDSLAATGVRFRNTYVNYPVCMSSRASLMTGRWPHELGVVEEEDDHDHDETPPAAETKKTRKKSGSKGISTGKSLGTLMTSAGYETVYFGKWHVDHVSTSPENKWHGFSRIVSGKNDADTATRAVEFLSGPHQKPFFMVVSFLNPHDICEWARLRSGIDNKMRNGLVALEPPLADCPPLPANFAIPADEPEVVSLRRRSQPTRAHPTLDWGETEWRQYRWAYARLIEKMDTEAGRVLDALRSSGQQDQTLVVYTSDHGDGDAAHHWNQKMVMYEEAVRVPLIISWPGHTAAGTVNESHLVSMGLDLLPTFCDFAGATVPAELTGHSLRPWTTPEGPPATATLPRYVVSEINYTSLLPGEKLTQGLLLRTPAFSYICYSGGKNPEQLFDLKADPGQTSSLVRDTAHLANLTEHRTLLREWIAATKSPFPPDRIP